MQVYKVVAMEPYFLDKIKEVMNRLYNDMKKIDSNEMRNNAQKLQSVIDNSFKVEL